MILFKLMYKFDYKNILNKMSLEKGRYKEYEIFKNKNVIITGATGAIGSELTTKFLQYGANVVGFIHNESKINPFLQKYVQIGKLKYILIELKYGNTITDNFKQAMMFLKGRLDILVCCHGKYFEGNVTDTDVEEFDQNININVKANFHLLSLSVPFLKISKGNSVMISSVTSKIVEKGDFLQALNKNMINSLIENAALELASFGVRVNGVALGTVNSDYRKNSFRENNEKYLEMMKNFNLLEKKNLEPENVADAILFLASDEAGFMTGEIMTMDNGFELNHDLSFINDRE